MFNDFHGRRAEDVSAASQGLSRRACWTKTGTVIVPNEIVVSVLEKHDEERRAAETLINKRYREQFGVSVEVNYPLLLALTKKSGEVLSAVGLRCAADSPLFLEQYLDHPIEFDLERHHLGRHRREQIAELGSFASVSNSASLYLVAAMTAYMETQRYKVVTVTGTQRLRRLFSVFEFELTTLVAARKERLVDQWIDWGSYYDDDPQVLAGNVRQCFEAAVLRARALCTPARWSVLDRIVAQVRDQA